MAAFGPRLGSFASRAAQNLSRIANSKMGHFTREIGTDLTVDFATNTVMDMLSFSPSDNVSKTSAFGAAVSSKSGFASQLIQAAMRGYEKVRSVEVSAQQPVISSSFSIAQRLQDLSHSVSAASNPNFSFNRASKFTEKFLGLIESPQFNFALSQEKEAALSGEKERRRQSPVMFNSILDEHNSFDSYFSATKDTGLSVKKNGEIAAEPEVEKKSTQKLK